MKTPHFHIDHPHIAAEIYYLSAKEGGRKTPVFSGYRGQFHIRNTDWDVVQEFIDKSICYPGESTKAYLKFATVHKIVPMAIGTPFQIREGSTIIARGVITVIIDNAISEASPIKTFYKTIDEIIWLQWDPLGVNEFGEARDEYCSYLPQLLQLLLSEPSKKTVADFLFEIETRNMGLLGNYDRCLSVANKFLEIVN